MTNKLKEPKLLLPKEGEVVLLYTNGKVVSKEDHTEPSGIFTTYDSFIGTKEEVEAKITELGLFEKPVKEIPKFDILKLIKKEETL
jgi:hypothetical protein